MKLNELKREILRRIAIARKEYFRLKKELSEIGSTLPQGTYLSTYTSNSKNPHTYYCLAHKQGLLVSAIDKEKRVYKFHLGRKENPRYLEGILAIERSQTAKAKQTALNAFINQLAKQNWGMQIWGATELGYADMGCNRTGVCRDGVQQNWGMQRWGATELGYADMGCNRIPYTERVPGLHPFYVHPGHR
ncbi:hypothetical protein NIES4106_62250 (plasmid) [Fischerella sp. NIES-4106]|nr:hypothetical protein NIES4106_62250 [Fischerella sp. NIES-4106]